MTTTVISATTSSLTVNAPTGGSTGAITVKTLTGSVTGPSFTYVSSVSVADLYVVGKSNTGWGYWKNNLFTALPTDCFYAYAVCSSGDDVYVGGTNTSYTPQVWKNGTDLNLPLTAGHNEGTVRSVFASGTDVYAVGEDDINSSNDIPKCWKNATPVLLSYVYGGNAFWVFVSGADVYVAGFEWSDALGGNYRACYWKNGVQTILSNGVNNDIANSIQVSGTDIYVAGSDGSKAVYWKNGVLNALAVPDTAHSAIATSIYISGTDVYVAGYYHNLAKYWKNGAIVDLTTSIASPSVYEYATGISGNGTDIYISGNDASKGYGYWKNGVFTTFTGASVSNGIFVK